MRNIWNKIKTKVAIFSVPMILFFCTEVNISIKERLNYLFIGMYKSAFILFFYALVSSWFDNNKVFFMSLSAGLLLNLLTGAWYHWSKGTFDIETMLLKNFKILAIVFIVYSSLMALSTPLSGNIVGEGFSVVIQFISILYPVSKALKSTFVLSGGKHPPEFIMKALYNYQKDGKLRDFFNNINGLNNENKEDD